MATLGHRWFAAFYVYIQHDFNHISSYLSPLSFHMVSEPRDLEFKTRLAQY
jgi:hypothetical protein